MHTMRNTTFVLLEARTSPVEEKEKCQTELHMCTSLNVRIYPKKNKSYGRRLHIVLLNDSVNLIFYLEKL